MCIFYFSYKKLIKVKIKEPFVNILSTAKDYQVHIDGVEKCDILRTTSCNVDSYATMKNLIDTGRIKKYKPDDRSKLDPTKEYCYIDNDKFNNFQDMMMYNKACNTCNVYFKDNPMFTNIFNDKSSDMVYKLPFEKCVLEIDPQNATDQNLDKFYSLQKNMMDCGTKLGGLKNTLDDINVKYINLRSQYNTTSNEYNMLFENNNTLTGELNQCFSLLNSNNIHIESLSNNLATNFGVFTTHNNNYLDCVNKTNIAKEVQNQALQFYNVERENAKLAFVDQEFKYKECSDSIYDLGIDKDKYSRMYTNVKGINDVFSQDNIYYQNKLESCTKKLDEQKSAEKIIIKKYEDCYPYIEKNQTCSNNKIKCDKDYQFCTDERSKFKIWADEKYKSFVDCTSNLKSYKEMLEKCLKDVAFFTRDNKIKESVIVVNSSNINVSSNNYIQCLSDTNSIDKQIEVLQQVNTDLYNELEKINRECEDKRKNYLENEIETIKIVYDDVIKTKQVDAEEHCDLNKSECLVGMRDCMNATVKVNYQLCVNSNDCTLFTNGEQYCAEACVSDSNCESIYYDRSSKKCYKFKTKYGENGLSREPNVNGGYTANFDKNRRVYCPIGSTGCMGAIGFANSNNIIKETNEADFDNCTYTCHETTDCRSVSFNIKNNMCSLYNNAFGRYVPHKEPIRHDNSDYMSADLDPQYCIKQEWGEWEPCVVTLAIKPPDDSINAQTGSNVTNGSNNNVSNGSSSNEHPIGDYSGKNCGLGKQIRKKSRGGVTCPEQIEERACYLPCVKRKCDRSTVWTKCSSQCGVGSRRRYKDPCSGEYEEEACNRDFTLQVWQDSGFKNKTQTYTCKNMGPWRQNEGENRYTWSNGEPFGISSFRITSVLSNIRFETYSKKTGMTPTYAGFDEDDNIGNPKVNSFDIILPPDEGIGEKDSVVNYPEFIPELPTQETKNDRLRIPEKI